ncbi:MAG: hypothetical protein A2046_01905 [Bacteroidetes bacterium GWA2_30_7]|nr:MAG: hypothetical protein A2046_01905 [Bacteroidetes bacterium GWA2_30_7]
MDIQERYNLITEITNDVITEINNQGIIVFSSKNILSTLGYENNEIINKNIFQYIHPDDINKAIERINKIFNGQQLGRTEYRIRHKSGNYIYFESFARVIDLENGNKNLLIIAKNISIQKENEIKYQQLIDNSMDIILIHHNGFILFINKNGLKLLGFDNEEEVKGHSIFNFIHNDYKEQVSKTINQENFESKHIEKVITRKGDELFVEIISIPIFYNNFACNQVIAKNITDKIMAETLLAESEIKFKHLVHQSVDGIALVNDSGIIIEWNKAQEIISGISASNAIGNYIWDIQYITLPTELKNNEFKEKIKSSVTQTLRYGTSKLFYNVTENRIVNNGEIEKYIQVSVFPINIENKLMLGYISRDITKQKEYEDKLKLSMNLAEEANQAKSKFLANISHEIRTPMNGILGFTEILLNVEKDAKKTEMLSLIKTSGETLLKLINDILDLSKIEAGKISIINKEFNLNELIESVVSSFKIVAESKNLTLTYRNIDNFLDNVIGDPLRIKQVLVNLISNAIKFTSKGEIKIYFNITTSLNNFLIFSLKIEDSGIGISKESLNKIFEEFYQENESDKVQGTGLGLSIVKRLITMMNGTINAESIVGKGSTFFVEIPFELPDNNLVNKNVTKQEVYNNLQNLKILVAEDDLTNQHLINAIAKSKKWNLDLVENGKLAVEKYQNNKYDIVLMDIQMPVMTGIEATQKIREIEENTGKHTPIIAFTAYAMINDKNRCINAGMDEYLSKPINFKELYKIIDKYYNK